MTYLESKKKLDEIKNRSELLFRMAISHLMDVGIRNLTDDIVEETCKEVMGQDDTHSFMTNEFQCDLIKTAAELAKIDHIHLLVYIQEEMFYDVGQDRKVKKNESELTIRLNDDTVISAQLNNWSDDAPVELCICLQDNDGVATQDICLVRPADGYKHEVEVLVWNDEYTEDYTHQFMINEYKED